MTAPQKQHWAAALIGRPWAPNGTGPHAFDCRGLVRHVWRERVGRDVPPLMPEVMHDARALVAAALDAGLRVVGRGADAPAQDMDIVAMTGPNGPHVGVMVADGRELLLLHAWGGVQPDGSTRGEVVAEPRMLAASRGFGRFLLWRWFP